MKFLNQIYDCSCNVLQRIEAICERPHVKKIVFIFAILVSFAAIYLFNILQPLFGDDWSYSMGLHGRRLENFSDIIESQYKHYFTWGGRTIVHIIAQSLLLMGIPTADFLNSLVFISLILLIYCFAINKRGEWSISLFIGINMLMWLFQPAFAQTALWIVGSANYLWGTFIILLFLSEYKKFVFSSNASDGFVKSFLFLFFGVIAGWTNENMAVAMIFMLCIFLYYFKSKKGYIPKWAVWGFVGLIIGTAFMLAAPGNYVRFDGYVDYQGYSVGLILNRFVAAIAAFYYYSLPLAFIYLLSLVIFRVYGKTENQKEVYFISLLFFAGAIVATLAMSASPFFPGRAAFGLNVFLIIAISVLYANMDFKQMLVKQIAYISIIFALLFFSADYYRGYKELNNAHIVLQERLKELEIAKKNGELDIVFTGERLHPQTRFFHYWELFPYDTDWNNMMFSRYYGIRSVKFIDK